MKYFIVVLLLMAAFVGQCQSVVPLRGDTIKIYKVGGYAEMVLQNRTKDSLGIMVNVGNGLTKFIRAKKIDDTHILIGLDTLEIGSGGGSTDTVSLSNRINLKIDSIQHRNDSVFWYANGIENLAYVNTLKRFGVSGEDDTAFQNRHFNLNGHDFSIDFDGSGNNGLLFDHTSNIATLFYNVVGTGAASVEASTNGATMAWYDFGVSSYGDVVAKFHNGRLQLSAYQGVSIVDDFTYNPATPAPATSAVLDIRSIGNNKGILIPRLNTTQQDAISLPTTGTIIWNTDSLCLVAWMGSAWRSLCGSSGGDDSVNNGLTKNDGIIQWGQPFLTPGNPASLRPGYTEIPLGASSAVRFTNIDVDAGTFNMLQLAGNFMAIYGNDVGGTPGTIYFVDQKIGGGPSIGVDSTGTMQIPLGGNGVKIFPIVNNLAIGNYVDNGYKFQDSGTAYFHDTVTLNSLSSVLPISDTSEFKPVYSNHLGTIFKGNYRALGTSGGTAAGLSGSVQIKSATTGTFGNAKNVTADSATGKFYADTTSAHTVRSDTVKFNYSGYWNFANVIEGYGHSMMSGQSATLRYSYFNTVQPQSDSTFRNRFATRLSLPDYNHGYSGTGAMDIAMFGIKYQDPANRALTLVMDGWNTIQNITPQVPATYNKVVNSNKFLWVNGNLKRWKSAGASDSVTTYGTWINYTTTATSAFPSAQLTVPLSETKSGNSAKQTTAINDSIVWICPVDSTVVIELLGWKSSGSTVEVFIDNVSKGTFSTNSRTDSTNTDIFVLGKVTYPLIFTGLPMVGHRVKVVNNTAGKLVVDFFGNLRDAKYSYPFIIVHEPDHGGTRPNIITNNVKQDSLVATIQAMGYPAMTFATNTFINAATDIAADSVHPSNSGHRHMDSGLDVVYKSHVPQGDAGALTFSNSLHERYSDAPYSYRRLTTTADINRTYSAISDVFTQDQYVYMNSKNFTAIDGGQGHYWRLPNLTLADSGVNTYLLLNTNGDLTDKTNGIRIFGAFAPLAYPDFMSIGGNSSANIGTATTSKAGAVMILDYRGGGIPPVSFSIHPTGTTTETIPFSIHESGGVEIGARTIADQTTSWLRLRAGTTTRANLLLDSTVAVTTPVANTINNIGPFLTFTNNSSTYDSLATLRNVRLNYQPVFTTVITATGTTGDQTINARSGTVNFATAATSLIVTNSLVTTSSIVFATVRTNDATAIIKNVVPTSGSFTITLNAATTAETSVGFYIVN